MEAGIFLERRIALPNEIKCLLTLVELFKQSSGNSGTSSSEGCYQAVNPVVDNRKICSGEGLTRRGLQGIIGTSLPVIDGLAIPALEFPDELPVDEGTLTAEFAG